MSDSWGKNMPCVIYSWDNVFGGQLSWGQLCRQQIIQKTIFFGGDIQVDIVKEQLSLG